MFDVARVYVRVCLRDFGFMAMLMVAVSWRALMSRTRGGFVFPIRLILEDME